ncbi:MAG: hypothetical protein IJY04_10755, partial [Clostridia bacterium]|nr:hypothetical protein [Clostridia bacterium]
MKVKKIATACISTLLALSALCGCAKGGIEAEFADGGKGVTPTVDELSYIYTDGEKQELSGKGIMLDFENKSVGTTYTAANESGASVKDGSITYRPKLSTFEIIESIDGKALKYVRDSVSAADSGDPHLDLEINGTAKAGEDFVVEMDIMMLDGSAVIKMFQPIYRPSSGAVFCAYMTVKDGIVSFSGKDIARLSKDEFTKFAMVVHQGNNTVDVYVNGYMVSYGVKYAGSDVTSVDPAQIRLVHSESGQGSYVLDNIALYKGVEPYYVSKVTEENVEMLAEYDFNGAAGAYAGESGMTVSAEKSSIDIIKTPDGRSALRYGAVAGDGNGYIQMAVNGLGSMWNFSTKCYVSGEYSDFNLLSMIGNALTPVLNISGTVLYDELADRAVCDLGVGRWNTVDFYVDETKRVYRVIVNGYQYTAERPITAELLDSMIAIRMGISHADEDFSVYIDDMRIYNATGVIGYYGAYLQGS